MRRLAIAFITLLLLALSVRAQTLPDAPAAPPDPAWNRLARLASEQSIVVTTMDKRLVHCLFGSVTNTYLLCHPPGNPAGVDFRFDRIDVLSVDFDRSDPARQGRPAERNYHPGWISSMIAGGLVVGIIASQNSDADRAARDGLIGAVAVGAIGAPFVFLPQPYATPPYTGPIYGVGFRLHRVMDPRHLRIVHLRHRRCN
jgi:hypothetical protein